MGFSCMWRSWDICFHTWWPVSDIAPDIRLTQWHCSRPRSSGCSRAQSPESISLESLWTQGLSRSGYSSVFRSRPLSTRIRWSHQSRTFCGVAYCSSDWGWACKFFGVRRTCGLLEGIWSLKKKMIMIIIVSLIKQSHVSTCLSFVNSIAYLWLAHSSAEGMSSSANCSKDGPRSIPPARMFPCTGQDSRRPARFHLCTLWLFQDSLGSVWAPACWGSRCEWPAPVEVWLEGQALQGMARVYWPLPLPAAWPPLMSSS